MFSSLKKQSSVQGYLRTTCLTREDSKASFLYGDDYKDHRVITLEPGTDIVCLRCRLKLEENLLLIWRLNVTERKIFCEECFDNLHNRSDAIKAVSELQGMMTSKGIYDPHRSALDDSRDSEKDAREILDWYEKNSSRLDLDPTKNLRHNDLHKENIFNNDSIGPWPIGGLFTPHSSGNCPVEKDLKKHSLDHICDFCFEFYESPKRCSMCKKVYYCSEICQRKDWPDHRKICHNDRV